MVNLWPGVPAKCLCDKHLNAVLAEYNNLLMPSMRKGHSIKAYLLHGCVDLPFIYCQVMDCMAEANRRGHEWKDPIPTTADVKLHGEYFDRYIDEFKDPEFWGEERRQEMTEMNRRVLAFRCPGCRGRLAEAVAEHNKQ